MYTQDLCFKKFQLGSQVGNMIAKRKVVVTLGALAVPCLFIFFYQYEFLSQGSKSLLSKSNGYVEDVMKVAALTEEDNSLNGPTISMSDPRLVSKIAKKFIVEPPPRSVPYRLKVPHEDPSMGQAEEIRYFLKNKKEGFFIECGALDGETRSNTLLFEKRFNWTGLLIEADPSNFETMLTKNRKAYLSPTCLSIKPYPMMVSFKQAFNIGKISEFSAGYKEPGYVDVQCFPLFSYLLALNRTSVDYFSLDVEGNELEVLRTIPFDQVDIKTLSVEYVHVLDGKEALKEFMEGKGYTVYSEVVHKNNLANDFIFVKS